MAEDFFGTNWGRIVVFALSDVVGGVIGYFASAGTQTASSAIGASAGVATAL